MNIRRRIGEIPFHLLFLGSTVSIIFLVYYLTSNALKPRREFFMSDLAVPRQLSLDAIRDAIINGNMLFSLRNSVILTGCSVAISMLLGACAAYAFSRIRIPFKTAVFAAMLIPMAISPLILSIPLFAQLARADLINTFTGGILVYVGLQVSFVIYMLEGAFRDIPDEVIEAARLDGASHIRVFFLVAVPIITPALVTIAIFVMLNVWNDLLVGLLFVNSTNVIPITANVVAFQQKFSSNPQMIFSGLLLSALPMLVVYALAQRFFVRGFTGGMYR